MDPPANLSSASHNYSPLGHRSSDMHSHSAHSHHFPASHLENLGGAGSSHFLASSPQATATAEQIKDIISKLASEAVEKRAEELVASPGRR